MIDREKERTTERARARFIYRQRAGEKRGTGINRKTDTKRQTKRKNERDSDS